MMSIPEKVKIGGIIYEVRLANEWPNHEFDDGETFYDSTIGNVIYIRATLSPEAKVVTFLHEVMHCMNTTMNHEFLDSLSEQWYQFLVDNKMNFT